VSARFDLKPRDHLGDPERKRALNEHLFTAVAPRYDAITRLLSFGRDAAWKRRLIGALPPLDAPACLDLACGTGDLTRRLARRYPRGSVLGLDLTPRMIELARARGGAPAIRFERGDLGRTGLPSAAFDVITGGYALRNAADLDEALAEVFRLLKPGGTAAFLDFSRPAARGAAAVEHALLKTWGGFWGLALHGNPDVYGYIADSLARFPDRDELARRFRRAGFVVRRVQRFFFGVIEMDVLQRPGAVDS
jgi:demethylmenaquinone methyltransferase/2-methoxy-6-polyprenyl-1,4-benzoquinol methylase